ncbi:MAG: biotin--[acetyl-CoA-carboxylase] ligase [Cyclobacteriaceae bacterium]|nr:biotin--[acetyl-CoA-carboxylase] ligase [Cyclobacteriaceae bacterium]
MPSCHSTNDIAAEWIGKNKAKHGDLFITDYQTNGRGQRGNTWETQPDRNLTFSIVLQVPFIKPKENFLLTVLCSLSLYDTLVSYLNTGIYIKWPNDMYYYDEKITGLLIENFVKGNVIDFCIAGIGLNVNQLYFNTPRATSMAAVAGQTFELNEVLQTLLLCFEKRYNALQQGNKKELKLEYCQKLYRLDQAHSFKSTENELFTGIIRSVNDTGYLMVEVNGKIRPFDLKEISFVI